mmetsp:Transcript_25587/g.28700  ORF Transcript_25587/g.28700 Transcript_25587/m.28700 type:complete len:932 (+) Transcript_25587:156-2951(+)
MQWFLSVSSVSNFHITMISSFQQQVQAQNIKHFRYSNDIKLLARQTMKSTPPKRERSLKRQLTKTKLKTGRTMNAVTTALMVVSVSCFGVYQTTPVYSFVGTTTSVTTLTSATSSSSNKRMYSPTASPSSSPSLSPTSAVYFTVDEFHATHTTDNIFKNPLLLHHQQQQKEQELFRNTARTTSDRDLYHEYDSEQDYFDNEENDTDLSIQQQQQQEEELPVWLRNDKSYLVDKSIEALRSAMLSPSSFFTESEVMQLTYAIQEAAHNNEHKKASAAEFCLIMVETMEMGLNALIAAAFHHCECIHARERSIVRRRQQTHQHFYMDINIDEENDVDALSHWEFRLPPQGIEQFDGHAARIERDAARLKRLEVVASMLVHHNKSNNNNNNENGGNINNRNNSPNGTKKAADNLRDLYTTEAKDWRALAIRGAACLYRLRGILQEQQANKGTEKINDLLVRKESNRKCREAFHIYAPLASRLGMHRLKNELEHAAFQILYRRQHRTYESLLRQTRSAQSVRSAARSFDDETTVITTTTDDEYGEEEKSLSLSPNEPNIGESMQEILAHVKDTITEFLNDDAVFSTSVTNFQVTARVKESYSTWKKMIRNGFDHITQVPDAMALRIVLDAKKEHPEELDAVTRARERALCYYAQQLCQTVWAPHNGSPRFKDYIANPKENGYQSLHYTAGTKWNNEKWRMEIQVRTGAMHKLAEFGVASHWNYKAGATVIGNNDNTDNDNGNETNKNNELGHFGKVTLNNNNQSSDAYLRSLQDWHWQQHGSPVSREPLVLWDNEAESRERAERIRARTQHLAPYLEALANEQNDLQSKNVFVFLTAQSSSLPTDLDKNNNNNEPLLSTEGTVVALPAGSSILDVILKCEPPVAENNIIGGGGGGVGYDDVVTQNGIPASLSSRLQNGDVLSIPSITACGTTTTG